MILSSFIHPLIETGAPPFTNNIAVLHMSSSIKFTLHSSRRSLHAAPDCVMNIVQKCKKRKKKGNGHVKTWLENYPKSWTIGLKTTCQATDSTTIRFHLNIQEIESRDSNDILGRYDENYKPYAGQRKVLTCIVTIICLGKCCIN